MATVVCSKIDSGMCNQFLTHFASKALCVRRGYSYRCGIQFAANGFPQLEKQYATTAQNAITLRKSEIQQFGNLFDYPFKDDQIYVLNGMLGSMEDAHFSDIRKISVVRRFGFKDVKENITQYQFIFTNKELLSEFEPGIELAQIFQHKMAAFQGQYLIGIHRRRGDYAQWNRGVYMDSDEQILEKINYFKSISTGRRPTFILCTDQPETAGALSAEADVFLLNADKEVEWLALQHTAFIIGAVSTFTLTAAGFSSIPYVFANEIITGEFQEYVGEKLGKVLQT